MKSGFSQNPRFEDVADALRDAADQVRDEFEKRFASRMSRGDVRAAVLALLLEQPMHGYQIMREIEQRSNGSWRPSAGSVYPTLQLLADEGIIDVKQTNGRKTYSLSAEGKVEAETAAAAPPWQHRHKPLASMIRSDLPKAGVELAQAAATVAQSGSSEQIDEAVQVLTEARRQLFEILARKADKK